MNRLERLINLTAALLAAEQPLTADDLRHRVPGYPDDLVAFRRAFERDKETLRDLGVPVTAEHPAGVGGTDAYRVVKEDYYLTEPGLADDELAALHLAASAVRVEGADGLAALWKLGGDVAEDGPAPATAAIPGAAIPGAEHLERLFEAISAHRTVFFEYRGSPRRVDPHRLAFRGGHWYLGGTALDRGESRSYRLDRVESAVAWGEPGSAGPPPAGSLGPGPAAQPWETGADEPVTARLWVDREQAGWAAGHVGPGAVAELEADGSVILDVRVTNRDAFRSFVLGFLDHAELLGPPELRADLVRWLEGLCPG